jgi:cytochrome c biogenesis factor
VTSSARCLKRLRVPAAIASAVLLVALITVGWKAIVTAGGLALAAWLIVGSGWVLGRRWWAGRGYLLRAVRPRRAPSWGLALAHLGWAC